MKATELVEKCLDIQKNYKTVYAWGCFGQPITNETINAKAKQFKTWYTTENINKLKQYANKGYFGFDCVNLIKGVLWGWGGDTSHVNGGAKYDTTKCADTTADGLIAKCKDVSTDFSNIEVGELVWIKGHVGLYIGDGLVVESTIAWDRKVQISACENIGKKTGYHSRRWTKHGKLPYITYDSGVGTMVNTSNKLSSKPIEDDLEKKGIVVGCKVKIAQNALNYTNTLSPVKIPIWVKAKTHTVLEIREDKARLKEINSWVYTKDIERV